MNTKTMNPWYPMTDPLDLKIMGKFGEELGECSAAVSRCIIQGVEGAEPVTGKRNRVWLEDKIADVLAGTLLVADHWGLDKERILRRAEEKMAQQKEWHAFA